MTAKSAPYPPCTVTISRLKYQDTARMLRRVTQPPHIAGPLWAIALPPESPPRQLRNHKQLIIIAEIILRKFAITQP